MGDILINFTSFGAGKPITVLTSVVLFLMPVSPAWAGLDDGLYEGQDKGAHSDAKRPVIPI